MAELTCKLGRLFEEDCCRTCNSCIHCQLSPSYKTLILAFVGIQFG